MTTLALLALLCQVIVPTGYMPAALHSGAVVQLCPQGISAELMAVLHAGHYDVATTQSVSHGDHTAHHDHANHITGGHHPAHHAVEQSDATGDTRATHSAGQTWQNHCPYGTIAPSLLGVPAADTALPVELAAGNPLPDSTVGHYTLTKNRQHPARAPPFHS